MEEDPSQVLVMTVQPQAIVEWIRPFINLGNDGYIEEDLRDAE